MLLAVPVALAVTAACSSKRTDPDRSATRTPGTPAADVASIITPDVIGVARIDAARAPIVDVVDDLLLDGTPACWTELVGRMTATYQLDRPGTGSYFAFQGPLDREEVERCVTSAFGESIPGFAIRRAGEDVVFDLGAPLGAVHTLWMPGLVVAGSREQIAHVRAAADARTRDAWRSRLAKLPAGPFVSWRSDAMLARLLGVPTVGYVMAFDRLGGPSNPGFAGRVIAEYATAEDAATAAGRVQRGETHLEAPPPPEVLAALKGLSVTQRDAHVTVELDSAKFENIDGAVLQRWLGDLEAHAR